MKEMADTYNVNNVVQTGRAKQLALYFKQQLEKLDVGSALRGVTLAGNTLKFYTTTDTTKAAAFTFDLAAEQFLDATGTKLEAKFAFSAEKYAGATNPNLDGKAVLVLAVKTKSNDGQTETTNYSFLDVSTLVDIYEASDTSIVIDSDTNKISVGISKVADNAMTLKNDGLHVDISGKVDKLTTATAGNIATFVAGGNLSDTGIAFATEAEFNAMLNEVFGTV